MLAGGVTKTPTKKIDLKVSGTLLWKEAQQKAVVPGRSWQSMKVCLQPGSSL